MLLFTWSVVVRTLCSICLSGPQFVINTVRVKVLCLLIVLQRISGWGKGEIGERSMKIVRVKVLCLLLVL
jgi:hypothetical protein